MTTKNSSIETSKWEYNFICPTCGEEFIATRRNHKYCDVKCKQIAFNERKLKYKDQADDRNDLEKLKSKFEALQIENTELKEQVLDLQENLKAEDNANLGLVIRKRITDELNEQLKFELGFAKEQIKELEEFINVESVED